MPAVSVRYIVNDVAAATGFYCGQLGAWIEVVHPAQPFAMLFRGDTRLVLSDARAADPAVAGPCADVTVPTEGGWNRFQLEVTRPHRRSSRSPVPRTPACAATAARAWAATRSSWRGSVRAIRSSCSSRPGARPALPADG